jgi:hypothetical protein
LAKEANPDKVEVFIVTGGDHMLSLAEHQKQVGCTVTEWFKYQAGVYEQKTDA